MNSFLFVVGAGMVMVLLMLTVISWRIAPFFQDLGVTEKSIEVRMFRFSIYKIPFEHIEYIGTVKDALKDEKYYSKFFNTFWIRNRYRRPDVIIHIKNSIGIYFTPVNDVEFVRAVREHLNKPNE